MTSYGSFESKQPGSSKPGNSSSATSVAQDLGRPDSTTLSYGPGVTLVENLTTVKPPIGFQSAEQKRIFLAERLRQKQANERGGEYMAQAKTEAQRVQVEIRKGEEAHEASFNRTRESKGGSE